MFKRYQLFQISLILPPTPSANGRRLIPTIVFLVGLLTVLLSNGLYADTTVLFLGDSLTAGYGVEKEQAFPALCNETLIALGYRNIKVVNGGVSGSTTASALQRMHWYMKLKPDILILELGANDGLRGHKIDTIRQNLSQTIQFALDQKIVTVLVGMKLPVNYGKDYTRKFEQLFPALAKKYSIQLIPFLLEGVAGNPELNLADGIHPNPKGHKIVAETILNYILPLVKKSDESGK